MVENTPKPTRTGRGIKWALGLSLAVNLIIVGFVGGAVWRFSGPDAPQRKWRAETISSGMAFVHALPREARREMRQNLRGQGDELPNRAERRALYEQVLRGLRAESFDQSAIESVFAVQASTAQTVLTRAQAGWLGVVSNMDVSERRIVADRLEEALRRGHKRGGPKKGANKP